MNVKHCSRPTNETVPNRPFSTRSSSPGHRMGAQLIGKLCFSKCQLTFALWWWTFFKSSVAVPFCAHDLPIRRFYPEGVGWVVSLMFRWQHLMWWKTHPLFSPLSPWWWRWSTVGCSNSSTAAAACKTRRDLFRIHTFCFIRLDLIRFVVNYFSCGGTEFYVLCLLMLNDGCRHGFEP